MNNIFVVRNPDTLEIMGFAPIYDSGNSMFYNIPYTDLENVKLSSIKTHSFIDKESKLLSYVQDRNVVDIEKAVMSFDIYEKDLYERQIRIPRLKQLYEQKLMRLGSFQKGRNIWKDV